MGRIGLRGIQWAVGERCGGDGFGRRVRGGKGKRHSVEELR